jgi:outer membrane murein-binding lipoprotein Lpp
MKNRLFFAAAASGLALAAVVGVALGVGHDEPRLVRSAGTSAPIEETSTTSLAPAVETERVAELDATVENHEVRIRQLEATTTTTAPTVQAAPSTTATTTGVVEPSTTTTTTAAEPVPTSTSSSSSTTTTTWRTMTPPTYQPGCDVNGCKSISD